jgi:chemotaxis protein methyltransferase CheR
MSRIKTISAEDFLRFRDFFYKHTGIYFDAAKRYFVDRRVIERMEAVGATDFNAYFMFLRFQDDGAELQALINTMTVNETYFLREEYQFQSLVRSVLPEIVERKRSPSPIRIWVIPVASGEEAYSIAMYLLEEWPDISRWDVELVASDIDTDRLAQARGGWYSARSVQYVPPQWLEKYFEPVGAGYQICETLRQSVEFTRVNLLDPREAGDYRGFDVIFCRNLLIYFDDRSRRLAAETLYDALKPGGYVYLGHAESMSRISPLFRVRRFPEAIVYQRPWEGQEE